MVIYNAYELKNVKEGKSVFLYVAYFLCLHLTQD